MLAGLAAAPGTAALALAAHRATAAGARPQDELRCYTVSAFYGGRAERLSAGSYVITMDVLSRYPASFMTRTRARAR